MRLPLNTHILLCLAISIPLPTIAEQAQLCHPIMPPLTSKPVPSDKMHISAQKLQVTGNINYQLSGDVKITTENQVLQTNNAKFNDETKQLEASGDIIYQQPNMSVLTDSLTLNLATEEGEAKNTEYRIATNNGNGNAGRIAFQKNKLQLENADYSTCPPEKKVWQISAEKISLDHAKNLGIARNAKIEIFSVPVIYLPYISFPLQGRKSGLLAPTPAYSSTDGFDLSVPYYFNISPNYDMTLNPRYIQKRGVQLGAEYRYLQQNWRGEMGVEYLPSDQLTHKDRYQFHLRQHNYLSDKTWFNARANHVSDTRYFTDLGTSLNSASQSQLNRQVDLQSYTKNWYFSGLLQDYQMLNSVAEPYRRLPQLTAYTQQRFAIVASQLFSQYSYFYKNQHGKIQRLVLNPSLSIPWVKPAGYFTPTLGIVARGYQTASKNLSQTNWYLHSTAALYFDRTSRLGRQTLSPRLSYLYMPQKSQTDLPLIDTRALTPSYDSLFYPRRYSGWDRFGDTQRISWGLENSWNDQQGQPLLMINLAHAHLLADQTSQFSEDLPLAKGDNLYATSVKVHLNQKLQLFGGILSKNSLNNTDNGSMTLRYRHNPTDQLELRHDFRSNLLQQSSLIVTKTLNPQWRIATRWAYSNKYHQIREGLLGLEYNNCCWSVRLIARRFANVIGDDGKNTVALQFELKGLTAIGSNLEETFSQEIFGIQ